MSKSIDERIVEMQFNNRQFESGVKESLGTIDKLKKGLNLEGASKGLNNLNEAGRRFSLAGIAEGVDTIASKFTTLGIIGVTALQNIVNSAVNAGKELVKGLTIDPISAGYEDYNRKLTSVQTIMNATGKDIKTVEGYFKELDTYADKTIYNLDDMTSSFAKFTNAGVDLDKSVPAIKGIANMVALAGQDANAAKIAMYNLSQSIAGGFLTTMDYKSLNLANVATKEWKEQMIKGAIAAGTLRDVGKGLYKTYKGTYTEAALFTEALTTDQWATTDVILKVLGKYGNELTEIGKKAQAAAQDVKSFPMMMETLKASVGTGWTDTFDIIIGDLEESKALFTGLTNTIGGFLDKISNARNEMLQVWKDNGGRTDLIASFENIFEALNRVLTPIKEAFREIFPPMTGERLAFLTKMFRNFTEKLIIGDNIVNNIKRTFKGFFAILNIGKQVISAIVNGIGKLIKTLSSGTSGFLNFTAGIGDFLVNLNELISKNDIFGTAIEKVGEAIEFVIKKIVLISEYISGYIQEIKTAITNSNLFSDTLGLLKNGFLNISKILESVSNKFREIFSSFESSFSNMSNISTISNIGDKIKISFKDLGNVLDSIKSKFKKIGSVIESIFGPVIEWLLEKVKELRLADIGSILTGGGLIMLAKTFKNALSPIQELGGGFAKVIESLNGPLEALQTKIKAEAILKIAIALGIMAASILVLSLIDKDKLTNATFVLSILFAELSASILILQKASIASPGISGKLIALGVSVLLLAIALKTLSELDKEKLYTGVEGLASILTVLALFIKVTSGSSGIQNGIAGIMGIGLAVLMLSGAMKILGSMKPEALSQGIEGLASILAVLALFIKLIGDPQRMISVGIGIVAISMAMNILAGAIALLGLMPLEMLGKGIGAMAASLLAMVLAIKLLPNEASMISFGIAINLMAVSLYIMAGAIAILGNMPLQTLAIGIGAMAAALGIMAGASRLMSNSLTGAASLLAMAFAINIIVPAIALLGSLELKTIGIALLALVGVFTVLGLSALILAPLAPVIFSLAISIALLGIGVAAIGGGLILFAAGLAAVVAGGAPFIAAITAIILGIIALIPTIAQKIGEGIVQIVNEIAKASPELFKGMITFLTGLLEAIDVIAPKLIDTAVKLILLVLKAIDDVLPKLMDTIMKFINLLLDNLIKLIPKFVSFGIDMVLAILEGLVSKLPDIVDAAFKLVISFINGLADAIRNNHKALFDAVENLIKAISEAVTTLLPKILDIGKNVINGIIKGVESMAKGLAKAAIGVVKNAVSGIKSFLGINSPSKLFAEIGKHTGEGMIIGIKGMSGKVAAASKDLGKTASNSMSDALSHVSDALTNEFELQPKIRPVVDMTDVEKGFKSTFNKQHGLNVAASADRVSIIASQRQNGSNSSGVSQTTNTDQSNLVVNNHYTVRNDNDIRKISRDQRNLLDRYSLAKGVPVTS